VVTVNTSEVYLTQLFVGEKAFVLPLKEKFTPSRLA
jgi:hypothetical protein